MTTTQNHAHAILFADWNRNPNDNYQERYNDTLGYPSRALLPLIDKPILQIAIEHLVRLGVGHIDLMLDDAPADIRKLVGNGERWGVSITIHYYDPLLPLNRNLQRLNLDPDKRYWLASAESLPLNHEALVPTRDATTSSNILIHSTPAQDAWSGWGVLKGDDLKTIETPTTLDTVSFWMMSLASRVTQQMCDALYSVNTVTSYHQSQLTMLRLRAAATPNGIIMARSARLHPGAMIRPPLYIGPRCLIGPMTKLGPNTVISEDSVISDHTEIVDSIIMPGTSVATNLSISQSVASQRILMLASERPIDVTVDDALIGTTSPGQLRDVLKRWMVAALLWLALTPVAMLTRRRSLDQTSTGDHQSALRYPWLANLKTSLYPGIGALAQGDYTLFGPSAKPLSGRPGLLNERMLDLNHPNKLDGIACDAMALAGLPVGRKAQILVAYSLGLLGDSLRLLRMILSRSF